MFLLLLVACGVTVRPICTETRTELADDEGSALGFSAADVLAAVVGEHTGDGEWDDGTAVTVDVTVARGVGLAVLVDQEVGHEEKPNGQLFGRETLLVGVVCHDYVEVPTNLAITTEDGGMDFSTGAATARAAGLDDAAVRVRLDASAMNGVPPSTREASTGFAEVAYVGDEMYGGSVGWEGETETSAWAEYTLKWGGFID